MVDFFIKRSLQKFGPQNFIQPKVDMSKNIADSGVQSTAKNLINQMQSNIINNIQQQVLNPETVKMNHLASVDRSVYIKNLLKLPNNMTDLLIMFADKNANKNINQTLLQNQQITQQAQGQIQHQQNLQAQIQQQLNQPQIQPQVQPPLTPPKDAVNQNTQKPEQNPHNHGQNQNQNNQGERPQKPQLTNNPSPIFQQTIQNQIKHQLNMQAIMHKGQPTGGAANSAENIGGQNQNSPQPNLQNQGNMPNSLQARLHQQLLNHARFEPMANLQQSIRNQIRQPINLIQKPSPEKIQQEVSQELAQIENQAMEQAVMKEVSAKVLPEKINLSNINNVLQKQSKMALNNLIVEMSNASKQGISDTKPIQDTIGLINSSISATSQNDTALAIKNLMLLYLPWLPLEEGVGFKLDVETKNTENPDDDTSISIMITTKNYGNINAVINLITTNSVDIYITCSKEFPKNELLKRLNKDSNEHAMQTSIGVEEVTQTELLSPEVQKAKVNLSNVTTINPYLLLMSHSFIRHAIEIDINTTMYGQMAQG